jgi:hypothetical protein
LPFTPGDAVYLSKETFENEYNFTGLLAEPPKRMKASFLTPQAAKLCSPHADDLWPEALLARCLDRLP